MHPNEYNARRGVTRAMFAQNLSMNPMLRGPMVTYDADRGDGGGGGGGSETETDEDDANADEENENNETPPAEGEEGKPKPTDAEAKLLREQMKTKKALKEAKDASKAAQDALKAFDGVDVEEYKRLKAAQAEAERAELERKGEYDRIVAQINEQHAAAIGAVNTQLESTKAELAAAQARIDELTVGNSFGNSKFLSEETVLTPAKARKLYGEHFEIVDGKTVGYDKPKGAADRTPLVDAAGNHLSFEAAIEKIVRADEDFERIAKSKLKPGSASQGTQHKTEDTPPNTSATGVSRIAANLAKLVPQDQKAK